ncbi:hypothetical protein [Arcticibacter tournemirensis]|uniref:Copper resistance protein NlpE n=1 Tax=Arcticibacter tournemirensis TaxID=699437 RepID=A0A4Q0MBP4_9SPHI|nr:hypothetical protein [Arcticibacter tournemirensis]RXF70727.1 hypothetical protein EKH83_08805 [Arcticibacter tournemirensis]
MKLQRMLVALLVSLNLLYACNGGKNKNESTNTDTASKRDSVTSATLNPTLCFEHYDGTKNQDTTILHLEIFENNVKGDLKWIPSEKDGRTGTIKGTKDGDLIKGIWTYMQEGQQDSLPVEFKLLKETILQKAYAIDPKTGRESLSDTSGFTIEFKEVPCVGL